MKVFMSYAQADRDVAKELASRLEQTGHSVWYADAEVFPGENWALEVGKALKESRAMVVLLSPQAMKSVWMRREIDYALASEQYRGRLIPVIVKPTSDIPWILKKLPAVRLGKRLSSATREIGEYIEHGFDLTPAKA